MRKSSNAGISEEVWSTLRAGDFGVLDREIFSEVVTLDVADAIEKTASYDAVFHLIDRIPAHGASYDKNVANILQHLEAELIASTLEHVGKLDPFYESRGLAWVIGELRHRNPFLVEYLYNVVCNAQDSVAWWNAAHSLEKIGVDDAVSVLKRSLRSNGLRNLDEYLRNLGDKRSVVGVLMMCTVETIRNQINPCIKRIVVNGVDTSAIANCCWLIGRLRQVDKQLLSKLILLYESANWEIKRNAFIALQRNASKILRPVFEKGLEDDDYHIRCAAILGLRDIENASTLALFEKLLVREKHPEVISHLVKSIYYLKTTKVSAVQVNKMIINENGLIAHDGALEQQVPQLRKKFGDALDSENICFDFIVRDLSDKEINNPIDLRAGTGHIFLQFFEKFAYKGDAIGVEANSVMYSFLLNSLKKKGVKSRKFKMINSNIIDLGQNINIKSNLIIYPLGFPERMAKKKNYIEELKSIYSLLADDGLFYTLGWEENFNDELSELWFACVPDNISAKNFEEWRWKRSESVSTLRKSGLTWYKRGINVPLRFSSLQESVNVMGHLFGRDAANYIIRNNKTEWEVAIGITKDTKQSLASVIWKLEEKLENGEVED